MKIHFDDTIIQKNCLAIWHIYLLWEGLNERHIYKFLVYLQFKSSKIKFVLGPEDFFFSEFGRQTKRGQGRNKKSQK